MDSIAIIIAIALSATFVLAAPLNAAAHQIYNRLAARLRAYETRARHPDDQTLDPGEVEIAIFGMGRVGTGAFEFLQAHYDHKIIGCDSDPLNVGSHQKAGRNVILGDPTDLDFWERIDPKNKDGGSKIRLVLLAMPHYTANMEAARLMTAHRFSGLIAASARFDDEVSALKEAGVHAAYNFFEEAGAGLAEAAYEKLEGHLRGKT